MAKTKGKSADKKSPSRTGSQVALAHFLGISVPTLAKEMRQDANFPVIDRGRPGVAAKFDFDVVAEYRRQKTVRDAATLQGGSTAAERRQIAEAALATMRVRREMGQLIERDAVLSATTAAYVRLGKVLDRFARNMGAELGWSKEISAKVRARLDEHRAMFAKDVQEFIDPVEAVKLKAGDAA